VKPAGRAVERLLQRLGIATDVARMDAVDAWRAVAVRAFGPDAAEVRAIGIDGEALVVTVPTSAWASEIRLRERELVAALAKAAPRSGIRAVRTVPAQTRSG
jgi:predicted nucleic acid-binding Zn ribbon protein